MASNNQPIDEFEISDVEARQFCLARACELFAKRSSTCDSTKIVAVAQEFYDFIKDNVADVDIDDDEAVEDG